MGLDHLAHVGSKGGSRTFTINRHGGLMAKDAPGMKGPRSRNKDGELRDKRDDTRVDTIEKKYHRDFKVRSDMHLGTLLQRKKAKSLNDLITGK